MKTILSLVLFCVFSLQAQEYRYTTELFPTTTKTADVVYGNAPFIDFPYYDESSASNADLVMDIYTPTGDTHNLRPAIIFAHSGAFLNGDRNHEDMVAFCEEFAKKGYVTATFDYRKGFYLLTNVAMHGTRGVYRGIQDGRSAVRFLRANASTYGIDPDKVYLAGSSAGAFIALHAAYMNNPAEQPIDTKEVDYFNAIFPFFHNGPDLGPVDVGANLAENGQPDAILSLWGALQSTDLVTVEDTTPIFMAHGTDDSTVLFESGSPFGYPLFPSVDGSNPINAKLDVLNFTNKETYFVNGEGHEFYGTDNGDWPGAPNAFWPIVLDKTTNFLWLQHKPDANFSSETFPNLEVTFTDESVGSLDWWWDFGDGMTSNDQDPTHMYTAEGTYDVNLYIENDIKSWDQISMEITVEEILGVDELELLEIAVIPNPAATNIQITSTIELTSIEIYNTLGQLVQVSLDANLIDISSLSSGVYIIKAKNESAQSFVRLIKQ